MERGQEMRSAASFSNEAASAFSLWQEGFLGANSDGFGERRYISSSLSLLHPDVVPSGASTTQVPCGHRGATTAPQGGCHGQEAAGCWVGWARRARLAGGSFPPELKLAPAKPLLPSPQSVVQHVLPPQALPKLALTQEKK